MRSLLRTAPAVLCMLGSVSLAVPNASARSYGDDDAHAPVAGMLSLSEAPLRSLTGGSLAPPGTAFVDGISDQSLPSWDGSFAVSYSAGFFHDAWVAGLTSHIALARYVVQWNVMSGAYPAYLVQLESWYRDVLSLGLTPEISLAAYDGTLPGSYLEYRDAL